MNEQLFKILEGIFILSLVIASLIGINNIYKQIDKYNIFKPDFKFQYYKKYQNPQCEFNDKDVAYFQACAYLINFTGRLQ